MQSAFNFQDPVHCLHDCVSRAVASVRPNTYGGLRVSYRGGAPVKTMMS